MKNLKRIRYYTMNSWNLSTAPAYNLKVYNVIDNDLQNKVYELMESDYFYDDINWMIEEFDREFNYEWQAGFNGRSGGYLVLYSGGRKLSEHKSICTDCGQRNFKSVEENGNTCGACGEDSRVDREMFTVYSQPGLEIADEDVPADVKKAFRRLALDIVRDTEYKAKHYVVEEEEYQITKTRKVLVEA